MTDNEMLDRIVDSLKGYPTQGGDIRVMAQVDRILYEKLTALQMAHNSALGYCLREIDALETQRAWLLILIALLVGVVVWII